MKRQNPVCRLAVSILMAGSVGASAACDEASTGVPLGAVEGVPRLVAVSSTNIVAPVETLVPLPLRLRVLGNDGRPIQSAVVKYRLLQGRGAFSSDSTLTNDQGFTESTFVPDTTGVHRIEARLERGGTTSSILFSIEIPEDLTTPASFLEVSGDAQSAIIGSILPAPFVVQVIDRAGDPVTDHPVTFTVQQSRGTGAVVQADPGQGGSRQIVVETEGGGLAEAFLQLGSEPGIHTVTASAVVIEDERAVTRTVTFTATAQGSVRADKLIVLSGETQTVVIDTLHERDDPEFQGRDPNPFVVRAVDEFGNPMQGVVVQWRVSDGGGRLALFATITDQTGITQNTLHFPTEGRNVVVAFAAGTDPVAFTVIGEVLEPPPPPEGEGDGEGDAEGG